MSLMVALSQNVLHVVTNFIILFIVIISLFNYVKLSLVK
jgi:hypothetical protein